MNIDNSKQDYKRRMELNSELLNHKRIELESLTFKVHRVKEDIRDLEELERIYKTIILEDK